MSWQSSCEFSSGNNCHQTHRPYYPSNHFFREWLCNGACHQRLKLIYSHCVSFWKEAAEIIAEVSWQGASSFLPLLQNHQQHHSATQSLAETEELLSRNKKQTCTRRLFCMQCYEDLILPKTHQNVLFLFLLEIDFCVVKLWHIAILKHFKTNVLMPNSSLNLFT